MANDTSGLCIKLKIPKSSKPSENREEGGGEGGGESSTKLRPFSRFCHVCNKGFSSGKALGGHMRMHVQVMKKVGDELCNNGGQSGNYVCFLCPKVFPSMKSLFGHMRSHPERTWRGIQPPQVVNWHSSSSTLSDVDSQEFKFDDRIDTAGTTRAPAADLSKSLTNWSVTAKRGRASVSSAAASDSDPAFEDPLKEAASSLILFAVIAETAPNIHQDSGDPHCLSGRKKRKVTPEHPAGKSDYFKPDSSAEAQRFFRNGEDVSFRRKNSLGKKISGELDDEKPEFEMGIKKLKRNKGKKTTKEAVAGEAKKTTVKQPENCNLYRCSICSRTFTTHQALGGHRSGHNKGKNIYAVEAQAEAQVKEGESEKERRILDFDLNEPPSLNEEEEAEVAKNGDFQRNKGWLEKTGSGFYSLFKDDDSVACWNEVEISSLLIHFPISP